ncbi:hypothetical protein BDV95DRAFT_395830 [Massariosphaeria phaeospora]|uniref:Uncharacterized protein n=1 Tax=Massariosphaeria phaeospora TaxID=100035 RepID=A0A7C8M7G8_9PLEO|nr:hypothetical protein BDV95DRAFT_395830 [Massariosphaeria phaeospora]
MWRVRRATRSQPCERSADGVSDSSITVHRRIRLRVSRQTITRSPQESKTNLHCLGSAFDSAMRVSADVWHSAHVVTWITAAVESRIGEQVNYDDKFRERQRTMNADGVGNWGELGVAQVGRDVRFCGPALDYSQIAGPRLFVSLGWTFLRRASASTFPTFSLHLSSLSIVTAKAQTATPFSATIHFLQTE